MTVARHRTIARIPANLRAVAAARLRTARHLILRRTVTARTVTARTVTARTVTAPTVTAPTVTAPTVTAPTVTGPTVTGPTVAPSSAAPILAIVNGLGSSVPAVLAPVQAQVNSTVRTARFGIGGVVTSRAVAAPPASTSPRSGRTNAAGAPSSARPAAALPAHRSPSSRALPTRPVPSVKPAVERPERPGSASALVNPIIPVSSPALLLTAVAGMCGLGVLLVVLLGGRRGFRGPFSRRRNAS